MALKDLDFDLCQSCYHDTSDDEKKLYHGTEVDPIMQYREVTNTLLT